MVPAGSRLQRVLGLILIVSIVGIWPAATHSEGANRIRYAGWALEAYPEMSFPEMAATVRLLVQSGSNVVWIGHNNPGEVIANKVEPGLSYAVYEAAVDAADPRHAAAQAIVDAQHRMLRACRDSGVKAVLPVGYQIQMGQMWNDRHPGDLRRDASGALLDIYGGGVSASFYAASYRHDIEAYYRWLDAEFVRPYADTLLMLNLADEPMGGDYSSAAEAAFRATYGIGFDDVGDDPAQQVLLGQFESRYVVEYAIYSAHLWQKIHPGLSVTMSFDGAQARQSFTLPDVEALFRDTPSNFVVTFDAYPHDGPPGTALTDGDLVGLFLLIRSAGLYSARYGKPLWLWAAANSWGLSQASADPGTLSDAVANGLYLAMLVRQAGGDLQGITYWNYNVKGQGLYNDTHATTYQPDALFKRVSAALPTLRRLMALPASRPRQLVLAPPTRSYVEIGARRAAIRLEVQPFSRLAVLARGDVNAAVVGSLTGWDLAGLRAIVVLAPHVEDLAGDDLLLLRRFLQRDGKVVASPAVGKVLSAATSSAREPAYGGMVEQWGNLYVAQKGVAVLFEDRRHDLLSGFWREVLGLGTPQPGYEVLTRRLAFYYNPGPEPATVELVLPFDAYGYRYDDEALPAGALYGSRVTVTLGRREYLLLWPRNPWTWHLRL
jgi:hypothetical protein